MNKFDDLSIAIKSPEFRDVQKTKTAAEKEPKGSIAPLPANAPGIITVKGEDLVMPSGVPKEKPKNPYENDWFGKLSAEPSQVSDNGIKYDFNAGLRIIIPKELAGSRVVFGDSLSHTTFTMAYLKQISA